MKAKKAIEEEDDINEQKLRLTKAQADKIELENAIKRRDFVSVKEAEIFYSDLVYSFRNKILTLPFLLAREIEVLDNLIDREEFIRKALEKALLELSSVDINKTLEKSL